jgi:hypothetical protein
MTKLTSTLSLVAGSVATVGELFRACAQIHAASTAIEYQGRQISLPELAAVAARARLLHRAGVAKARDR